MIKWIKKFLYVIKHFKEFEKRIEKSEQKVSQELNYIKDRTQIHVDTSPGYKDPHMVIMCGHYRGRDYVKIFSLYDTDFRELIKRLEEMKREGHVERIEAPQDMRIIMEHELKFRG